ncbi:MAG: hypothetical protein L6Q77_00210 [Bacteroidetes bacterium]|nr:hypothetical protein [Bacteroidota bacterium]
MIRSLILLLSLIFITSCSWFEPKVTVVFTHNTNGFLEDCGCSGHKWGGLHRRAAVFSTVAENDPEAFYLDAGDVISTYYRFPLKDQYVAEIMKRLRYDAIGFGDQELINGIRFYDTWIKNLPMVSSNLVGMGESGKVLKKRGVRAAVISLVNPEFLLNLPDSLHPFLDLIPPKIVLRQLISNFQKEEIRNIILLSQLGLDKDKELAEEFPELSLIISGHDQDPRDSLWVVNGTPIVQAGPDGERVGLMEGKFLEGKFVISTFRRLLLDSTVLADSLIYAKIRRYHAETDSSFRHVETKILPDNPSKTECASCHQDIFDRWMKTPHAHAWETLVQAGVQNDPDCQSCHSTNYGALEGFRATNFTMKWANVNCQQCHTAHVPPGAKKCAVTGSQNKEADCAVCHTRHRSPEFDYSTWLMKVH